MVPRNPTRTTVEECIVPAESPDGHGGYRRLVAAPGEPHVRRGEGAGTGMGARPTSILYFAHLTDIQLCDSQSPVRLEMLQAHPDDPRTALLRPAQRPQEVLAAHAADSLVRAINAAPASPRTGAELGLVLTTGDMIDNAQRNELLAYLGLLSGGAVETDSGGPDYEGMQDGRYPYLWSPDEPGNVWTAEHGFPVVPGLLGAALRTFEGSGLTVPWLACYGNHDALVQGRIPVDHEVSGMLTGSRKPDVTGPIPEASFIDDPLGFLSGASRAVTPSEARRVVARREFVDAHFADAGAPSGHGFSARNVADATAYFSFDPGPDVRVIVLDTTNPAGDVQGSLDRDQLAWLEGTLAEVHAEHLGRDGRPARTGNDDRLVILASHHPLEHLTNDRTRAGDPAGPRVLGEELLGVIERFPNVIAWFAGHTHRHAIRHRDHANGGFWEVTTASVMEWPSQARLVEVIDHRDGSVSLVTTVIDHDAALTPEGIGSPRELASWHREIAANHPFSVGGAAARGEAGDRNAELMLPDPRTSRRLR